MAATTAGTSVLHCPQCQSPASPADRFCKVCGVDLALAALLTEREVLASIPAADNEPYVADENLPRLGDYLLHSGAITRAQLEEALRRQAEKAAQGRPQTLGQTLLELGAVSREILDRTLVGQIQELQNALLHSNRQLEARVAERTAELRGALERLTELNQLKSNFVSNVSHELRTPLGQIKGYAALLGEKKLGPLTAEQGDALKVLLQAADRLQRLVDDLIQYAASVRGEMTLNTSAVRLQQLAPKVLAAVSAKASKGQVILQKQIPDRLPPITADPEKIQSALFHLLDNAIKFTPAGGRVTLIAQQEEQRVHIAVADNGIGIPAHRLGELFQPFHQLDSSSTRRYGGTGIGLSLVKRIVEAHGARVVFSSMVGQGSVFGFELPVAGTSARLKAIERQG
ncbi:MAG: hypothetical protein HY260_21265 [Chloroflexi bacterium]|nr:hypothetical protein [Chloroflexota bacterium]